MAPRRAFPAPVLFADAPPPTPIRRTARSTTRRIAHEPKPCTLCGYPRAFRRGVCRSCHRKLTDGGLEQLPDLRSQGALTWLPRRQYLLAWRATLAPEVDRLLVEVFAQPLARPTDALSMITAPAEGQEPPV